MYKEEIKKRLEISLEKINEVQSNSDPDIYYRKFTRLNTEYNAKVIKTNLEKLLKELNVEIPAIVNLNKLLDAGEVTLYRSDNSPQAPKVVTVYYDGEIAIGTHLPTEGYPTDIIVEYLGEEYIVRSQDPIDNQWASQRATLSKLKGENHD